MFHFHGLEDGQSLAFGDCFTLDDRGCHQPTLHTGHGGFCAFRCYRINRSGLSAVIRLCWSEPLRVLMPAFGNQAGHLVVDVACVDLVVSNRGSGKEGL